MVKAEQCNQWDLEWGAWKALGPGLGSCYTETCRANCPAVRFELKVELLEKRLGCVPAMPLLSGMMPSEIGPCAFFTTSRLFQIPKHGEVWLPKWLMGNRERQLTGFVHPATADGLMKALRGELWGPLGAHMAIPSLRGSQGVHRPVFRSSFQRQPTPDCAHWRATSTRRHCPAV